MAIPADPPEPFLTDGRIGLRVPRLDDATALAAALDDPLIPAFTHVPSPYREEDAMAWIAGASEERAAGRGLALVVTPAAAGELAGGIGLHVDRDDRGRASVGYWTASWARGRGFASAALVLLSDWALGPGGFARLDLWAAAANAASCRVAERSGFVREGVARQGWARRGFREDLVLYGRLPGDPPAAAG